MARVEGECSVCDAGACHDDACPHALPKGVVPLVLGSSSHFTMAPDDPMDVRVRWAGCVSPSDDLRGQAWQSRWFSVAEQYAGKCRTSYGAVTIKPDGTEDHSVSCSECGAMILLPDWVITRDWFRFVCGECNRGAAHEP
jgi:hypothetical protein